MELGGSDEAAQSKGVDEKDSLNAKVRTTTLRWYSFHLMLLSLKIVFSHSQPTPATPLKAPEKRRKRKDKGLKGGAGLGGEGRARGLPSVMK